MSATSSGGIEECEAGLIAASIAQLAADDAPTVDNAAKMIFHHAQSAQNKDLVRELGGIPALCAVLRSNSGHHALSALNELACGNKMNCLAIVSTAGALSALVALFPYGRTPRDPHDSLSTQELSAMVINNCASFGEEACLRIVEHPCMLVALKHLARSGSCRTRCVTIGAMNCLSRCEGARESLMRVRIVEDMLLPALREAPVGAQDLQDRLAVRKMFALMALLNLTGRCDCEHVHDRAALASLVQMLESTLQDGCWAGQRFTTFSVLYPLCRMDLDRGNVRNELIACGLAELLANYVCRRASGAEQADADELELALTIIEQIANDWGSHGRLRQVGLVGGLQELGTRIGGSCLRARVDALVQRLELAPLAVCMGQHRRLGGESPIGQLDECVLTLIIGYCGWRIV